MEHTSRPTAATRRKRKAQQRKLASFLVAVVLTVLLMFTALLFSGALKAKPEVASSAPPASIPAIQSVGSSLAPASSSALQLPAATGEWDEEGLPYLFNFENPIPASYEPELISVGNGQQMDSRAGEAFMAMQAAAKEAGLNLLPVSGYRTTAHQQSNYDASIQRYLAQGLSEEEAIRRTRDYYAIPGTSEHEAGLAMDIGYVDDSFQNTQEFDWLQEHAAEFGFIMRYPDGADNYAITQIRYEPWHYRFVGANHAALINEMGITLEEYIALFTSNAA